MKTVHIKCNNKGLRKDVQGLIDLIGGIVDDKESLDFYVALDILALPKNIKKLKGEKVASPQMTIRWEGENKIWLEK